LVHWTVRLSTYTCFKMTFTPQTPDDIAAMLRIAGVGSVDELFSDVPEDYRFPQLKLPGCLSPVEVEREIIEILATNTATEPTKSFLGAGIYHHYVPPLVDDVVSRPEFYTAYTPYQPEISQGLLQATFEYQSMVASLTGMEVVNASHYDGATALAEAIVMALGLAEGSRDRVILSAQVNPRFLAVVETYLDGHDVVLELIDTATQGVAGLIDSLTTDTAVVVLQTPDFLGQFQDIEEVADALQNVGALLIAVTDPISLGLFKSPGSQGADMVVADGQPFGIRPCFGGPCLGVLAVRKEHVRKLVGRLVGETRDNSGRRGYVLTLSTREQHIRRGRATSNICTNSALGALSAAVYLAGVGRSGLREVAELCFHKAHYLADRIQSHEKFLVNPHRPLADWFREFVVELPIPANTVNATLLERYNIIGGLALGDTYPGWDNRLLVAVTEVHSRRDLDEFADALHECSHSPDVMQEALQ